MKKLIAIVLALVCVLSLVGCSNALIKGIDKAIKIEVVQYDKSNGIEIGTVALSAVRWLCLSSGADIYTAGQSL